LPRLGWLDFTKGPPVALEFDLIANGDVEKLSETDGVVCIIRKAGLASPELDKRLCAIWDCAKMKQFRLAYAAILRQNELDLMSGHWQISGGPIEIEISGTTA
jgi:hypothetical protein